MPFIVLYDGVPGVAGESMEAPGEKRFSARCNGRKMPAPRMVVLKYCTLRQDMSARVAACHILTLPTR